MRVLAFFYAMLATGASAAGPVTEARTGIVFPDKHKGKALSRIGDVTRHDCSMNTQPSADALIIAACSSRSPYQGTNQGVRGWAGQC